MTQIIKETVTTQSASPDTVVETPVVIAPVKMGASDSETSEYIIYYFFGVLEVFLSFRLILKLMGASVSSSFVNFIYGLTGIFIMPFEGIFHRAVSKGIETASVLEPSTMVAIIVYALLSLGIVKLIRVLSGEKQTS